MKEEFKNNGLQSGIIICIYRYGNWILSRLNIPILKKVLWLSYKLVKLFSSKMLLGVDIPDESKIGNRFRLPHGGVGVGIHPKSIIGDDVTIYHQVTLGGRGYSHYRGQETKKIDKYKDGVPIIGNRVLIGAGAKLIGPIKVGDEALIGSNAVVITDIPSRSTVVCSQTRILIEN